VRAKFECRTCGRRFTSLEAFDAHLGSDAQIQRGVDARLRGEPSQEGHTDPVPTKTNTWVMDEYGRWRSPGEKPSPPAYGLLAGLEEDEEDL
jgi:hypothetical protein